MIINGSFLAVVLSDLFGANENMAIGNRSLAGSQYIWFSSTHVKTVTKYFTYRNDAHYGGIRWAKYLMKWMMPMMDASNVPNTLYNEMMSVMEASNVPNTLSNEMMSIMEALNMPNTLWNAHEGDWMWQIVYKIKWFPSSGYSTVSNSLWNERMPTMGALNVHMATKRSLFISSALAVSLLHFPPCV